MNHARRGTGLLADTVYGEHIPSHTRLFHVANRVDDLDAAMAEMGRCAGLTWASIERQSMPVWMPDTGLKTIELVWTYSIEGPVHIELVKFPAGSIWEGTDLVNAHHFGYWCDDIGATTEALLACGWSLEFAGNPPSERQSRFAILSSPSGYRMELVNARGKSRYERWWAGGSLLGPA
ncbi:MAG: VOC family protein [Rhodospirillaceae bacterium]|nr:MAG: VOC family protein [Rhodospirillaceae bacterium]